MAAIIDRERIWTAGQHLPMLVRKPLSGAMEALSPAYLNVLTRFLPRQLAIPLLGDHLHKIASILNCANLDEVYETLISTDHRREPFVKSAQPILTWADTV